MKKKDYYLKKTRKLNKNKQIIGFADQHFVIKMPLQRYYPKEIEKTK